MEDPDTESEQSDQSSDGDESFADSLTEDVTRIRTEDLAENNLPAHSNGNYVEEKLETWDNYDAGYGDLPLDLRTRRGQEQGEAGTVTGEEVLEGRVRGGRAETKLATPPHLLTSPGSEKADFETKGEKIIESPQPFVSSSSFDSDSTKSFRDEGSPMSTKSSPQEAGSEESDGEQDAVSESLLQDLIISAMPTSSQDSLAPTPRPVWDTDTSNQTVLHEDTQGLRHTSANVSYDSNTSDDSGLQQCEELLEEEDEMVTYNVENSPLKQWRVSAGTAAAVDNNTNIINNNNNNDINRGTPRKEATFVLGDKINDAASEAARSCVKMRKSQSEQQLRAGEAEARRSDHRRSWTKSPRTSRLIPGVVIKELKLKPRSECKTPVKPVAENSDPVIDIKTEVPEVKQEVIEVPDVKVNILDKDVKMTSSVISNYDDTISKIEEPSAMVDICDLISVTEDGSQPRPSLDLDCLSLKSISHQLDSIRPPSLLDEVTVTSNTLIADKVVPAAAPPAATYLVEEEANTVDDVTDVFDEESTLTPRGGEEEELGLVPDLPLDSEHTTPTHSSSRATPPTVRKIRTEEREEDATSHLTYVIDNNTETSGYRSVSTDIIDVDARLTELMGEMYSWQVAEEELMEQEARQVRDQMFINILSIFTIFFRVYKYFSKFTNIFFKSYKYFS